MKRAMLAAGIVAFFLFAVPADSSQPTGPTGIPPASPQKPPCRTVPASRWNALIKKRKAANGRTGRLTKKSVCIRPKYRRLQAQLNKIERACARRGDPECRWLIRWRKLSPYDRQWTLRIGSCESGNDPRKNTGNGFYGAHQWVLSTWHAAGGSGSPTSASWHEQAVRAVRWRNKTSTMQWPACSRSLGYA